MIEYILILLTGTLFWFKSNSKMVFDLQWSPFQWWLYTGLLSNYMSLYAWWGLLKKYDIWYATAIWVLLTTIAEVILNIVYFEFHYMKLLGVLLCVLGAFVASL